MWKALLLCSLVVLSAAEQQNGAWHGNMKYVYKVQTHTLSGIPKLKNQWAGLITKADLALYPVNKDLLIGKLYNGEYSDYHGPIVPVNPNNQAEYQPAEEVSYQPMELNQKPFEVRLNNGAIHSVAVDKELTNIELNQLKSILSQLQVDIQARNYIKTPQAHLPQNQDENDNENQALYKVMEPTVTGKCETIYDITRVPSYLAQTYTESKLNVPFNTKDSVYEVVKTKNYTNCEQRMGYHFGVGPNDWEPNTSVMGSLTKSGVSRIIITGNFNEYTIRSSVTRNRIVKANSDKKSQNVDTMVVSNVNVTLKSLEETTEKPFVQADNLIDAGNLVYSYDLSSDSKNSIRPNNEQLEEENYGYSAENSFEKQQEMFQNQEHQSKTYRLRRSVEQQQNEQENAYSYSSYAKQYMQPQPSLTSAPENPMLHFFIGNKGRSIQQSNGFDATFEVEKFVSEIAADLEDPNETLKKSTLSKFSTLVKIIRMMSAQQIEQTTQSIIENNKQNQQFSQKSQQVYREALVSASTGPAIVEVMKLIEQQKIKGEEAVALIVDFPKTIRLPTEAMQKRFFEFVKNNAVSGQDYVNTTAGIAFTSYLFKAQVNQKYSQNYYPHDSYAKLTNKDSKFVSQEVIPYFAQLLEQAVNDKDAPKLLYAIRALGNLGHKDVPAVFEPYMSGQVNVTNFQRLAMVLALDKYTVLYPRIAQKIFQQLYINKGETSEIRSVAVMNFMRTKPSFAYMQRLAEESFNEENKDVRAVVKSALESAARLTAPEDREFAKNAQSALDLLKPETLGMQYSATHFRDYFIKEMEAEYHQQSSYIVNKDSFIPSGIFMKTISKVDGFKHYSVFQAMVSSVQDLVNLFGNQLNSEKQYNNYENSESHNEPKWTAENIMKFLNVNAHANQDKKFEGQMLLNMLNKEFFMAFDEQTIKQLPQQWRELVGKLRNGYDVKLLKMFNQEDVIISFPLESGLPFTYHYWTPTLVQVDGKVQAQITPNAYDDKPVEDFHVPEKVNVEANIKAVYSVIISDKMSFINPITTQIYSTGYDKKFQFYVPLIVKSDIDVRNNSITTEVKPLYENKATKFLQMGSWPYTTYQSVFDLRPISENEHTKEFNAPTNRQFTYTFGNRQTGFTFVAHGVQNKDSNQVQNVIDQLKKHDLTSLLTFGLESTSPEYFTFNVVLDNLKSSSKNAKFTFKYSKSHGIVAGQPNIAGAMVHPLARGQLADGSENLAIPVSTEPNSQQRRDQFLNNAKYGMSAPNADVLDVAVEFNGSKDYAYVATISGAVNQAERKSRILAFVQQSKSNDAKGFYLQIDSKFRTNEELPQQRQQQQFADNKPYADVRFKLSYAIGQNLEIATVNGNVQLKQSPEFVMDPKYKNAIDTVEIELDMKNLPQMLMEKEFGFKVSTVYNYLRYATLKYLNEDFEYKGQADKVSFQMHLSSDKHSANFTMKTPNMKTQWKGVPLPKTVKQIAAVPTDFNWLTEMKREAYQYRDTCLITGNQIKTFDNRTIKNVEFYNTWHVAVHKMNEYEANNGRKSAHYASILVKNVENNNENKKAMIVLHQQFKNDIELVLSPQNQPNNVPQVYVNGKEVKVTKSAYEIYSTENPQKELARLYAVEQFDRNGDKLMVVKVEIKSGKYEVIYNGKEMKIRSNTLFRNNGGICGAFTGQQINELKTPQNKVLLNENEFVASWALIEDSNAHYALKQAQQESRKSAQPKEEIIYGNPIPNHKLAEKPSNNKQWRQENSREQENSHFNQNQQQNRQHKNHQHKKQNHQVATKHQTQYVEEPQNKRICFSKRPLPVCADGSKANGKMTQSVEVYCRDINDAATQHYKAQIKQGRSLDLSNYTANAEIKFIVPKRCEKLW